MNPARGCGAVVMAVALLLRADPLHAQDIYTGTLHVDADGLLLRRCDLAGNHYRLRDAESATHSPVAAYLADPQHRNGIWIADVVGEYQRVGEIDRLVVEALENLQPGSSCHLLDALDALDTAP